MTRTVQVTRRYAHSPEQVFDAWLTPAQAGMFLFATPTGTMVKAEIDARVGGGFLFVDRRDGEDIEHVGEYLVIDRPRKLVFTFAVPQFSADKTTVSIEITPAPDGSELTLTHAGVLEDYVKQTEGGWTMILDSLAKTLG
jgi:uncharacterized protein YndB with AHSA1/START domain